VFLVSVGLLTLEIAFTRLFSFTIWYHFTYLTISVALMGLGASGAIVSAFPDLFRAGGQRLLVGVLAAASMLVVAALLYFARYPLELRDVVDVPVAFAVDLL
jgi:hypothetical protein